MSERRDKNKDMSNAMCLSFLSLSTEINTNTSSQT